MAPNLHSPAIEPRGSRARRDERIIDVPKQPGFSEWIDNELQDLRRMRDELRVQTHLAKAEVRDRWQALERTFGSLEQRAKRTSRAAEQPLQQIEADLRKLAGDLREGYRRIRDAI
jgi:hypothetical protein